MQLMSRLFIRPSGILLAFLLMLPPAATTAAESKRADPSSAGKVQVQAQYGKLPLSFEVNQGQTDPQVKFLARGRGYTLFLTPTEAVLALKKAKVEGEDDRIASVDSVASVLSANGPHRTTRPRQRHVEPRTSNTVLRMRLEGANADAPITGLEKLPGIVNYFLGRDPKNWRTNIPTYAKVQYKEIYPGIDLVYYGNQGQLEYDLIVAPGADPNRIKLAFPGAEDVALTDTGDLLLKTAGGEVRLLTAHVYQTVNGKKTDIAARYVLKPSPQRGEETVSGESSVRSTVGITLASYDTTRPLVIDPLLVYSTYLGGSSDDRGFGIAVDAMGQAYVTGFTDSADFPTTAGALQPGFGDSDSIHAFVTKLNSTGSGLLYSTYLGGSELDEGFGIAVDAMGQAYVTGETHSADFPTTVGAFQREFGGLIDAFVTKLNVDGSGLLYSTYLGGSELDEGFGIAVDAMGQAYVTGETHSADFPTTVGAFQREFGGLIDAFVTKLNVDGSGLLYSTYLGGSDLEEGFGIAVDAMGQAHVTGLTDSADFPTTAGAFDNTLGGSEDAFVTKLNAAGSELLYSTYLGGSGGEGGAGIAVDTAGQAYVTGATESADFPTTAGTVQPGFGGIADVFVTKLNVAGAGLLYSTYLGGSDLDESDGIFVDAAGQAYVRGGTDSADFPTTAGAFQPRFGGISDVFVTKLNTAGSGLLYSTYLGGSDADEGRGFAVDAAGQAYVTGITASSDFPVTAGAFQSGFGGIFDAFVAKIVDVGPPATLTLEPTTDTNPVNTQHCVTATVTDTAGNPVPAVTVRFTVMGSMNTSGTAITDANGQAPFCYTGPRLGGADTITAYADTDTNNVQDAGEPGGAATKTWVPGAPATVALTPATATNPVNTEHCVTTTVQDEFGNPTPGITVRFTVTGAVNTSGSATTNGNGEAPFCYTGPRLGGADTITAYADTDTNNVQDAGEPGGSATKTWEAGAPPPSPSPAQLIQELIARVDQINPPRGVKRELIHDLEEALEELNEGENPAEVCEELDEFIEDVRERRAQRRLTPAETTELLDRANQVEAALGCLVRKGRLRLDGQEHRSDGP